MLLYTIWPKYAVSADASYRKSDYGLFLNTPFCNG
jgi:hypothetical protein